MRNWTQHSIFLPRTHLYDNVSSSQLFYFLLLSDFFLFCTNFSSFFFIPVHFPYKNAIHTWKSFGCVLQKKNGDFWNPFRFISLHLLYLSLLARWILKTKTILTKFRFWFNQMQLTWIFNLLIHWIVINGMSFLSFLWI